MVNKLYNLPTIEKFLSGILRREDIKWKFSSEEDGDYYYKTELKVKTKRYKVQVRHYYHQSSGDGSSYGYNLQIETNDGHRLVNTDNGLASKIYNHLEKKYKEQKKLDEI